MTNVFIQRFKTFKKIFTTFFNDFFLEHFVHL